MSRRLATALTTEPAATLIVGTVTATTGSTLTVDVLGQSFEQTPRLGSYTPTVGDSVLLIRGRTRMYAIGKVA